MITVDITYLVIGGVILLYLIYKNFEFKSKLAKPEHVYVDTSGIASNPPKFIEVLQNKTINFNIGKHSIKISQLTVGGGLTDINKIAILYRYLLEQFEKVPKNKLEEIQVKLAKDALYKHIIKNIYRLSKPFAKNKRAYKKELFNVSKKNHEIIFLITEQIFDYWMYIKKLLALLAQGGSQRMIIGEGHTWNSYETDTTGDLIIKPRFVLSTN